ncbi:MAG: hypothetical protein A2Y93_14540 [Chloroflexi bacterium RBG_13_68_17]|nr:MAG: hypothetical protein A2Y93_14540 [Chloroflexi bacterium RBG_13_68_17]
MRAQQTHRRGMVWAAASASLMGTMPIFGRLAIVAGLHPLSVVALRTIGAAALLLVLMLLVRRRTLYIYPLGLVGCLIAGALNGAGSLLFYTGLARLNASLVQLLFSMYPVFTALLLYLDGQRQTPLTLVRLLLSLAAVLLLSRVGGSAVDLVGAACVVGASILYALHIPINQRVLYEVPAPTVTVYTLLAMAAVVVPFGLLTPGAGLALPTAARAPLIALTVATFLSRLALFAGVKHIGGMQTALLGLAELLVTIVLAHVWLGERLTPVQWSGAGLLVGALLLAGFDRRRGSNPRGRGWLRWLGPPSRAEAPTRPAGPLPPTAGSE